MKHFIPVLVLALSVTDFVYASCPEPSRIQNDLGGALVSSLVKVHKEVAERNISSFFQLNPEVPRMSFMKNYMMTFVPISAPLVLGRKISDFHFTPNFDELVNNMKDPYEAAISVQESEN